MTIQEIADQVQVDLISINEDFYRLCKERNFRELDQEEITQYNYLLGNANAYNTVLQYFIDSGVKGKHL